MQMPRRARLAVAAAAAFLLATMACTPAEAKYGCSLRSFSEAAGVVRQGRCRELAVKNTPPIVSANDPELAEFLDALRQDKHVRELKLQSNGLGDAGVTAVAEALAQRNVDLFELEITANGVTDSGVASLEGFLTRSTALRELNLARNTISDDGASVIANALPSHTHEVDLSYNKIGDVGLLSFLHAASQGMLRELELESNAVTTEGALAAASFLAENTWQLREIDLRYNTLIGPEGYDALRAFSTRFSGSNGGSARLKISVSPPSNNAPRNGAGPQQQQQQQQQQQFHSQKRSPQRFQGNLQPNASPKRHSMSSWTEEQVGEWIKGLHPTFSEYGNAFTANAVNGAMIGDLTDADLKELGIASTIHRKRILSEIRGKIAQHEELR